MKRVHVVSGESAEGTLTEALALLGDTSRVVCFDDNLSIGPLADTAELMRADWLERKFGVEERQLIRQTDRDS